MKFKYSEYCSLDGLKIYRPTIPIMFKTHAKYILTEAIIDTGADFTILPIELAGYLEIKLDLRTRTKFHGAGSNPFTVYPSPFKIQHILKQDGFRQIQWEVKIFFAESQPGILLGHKGFLEKFKVIFDGPKKELEILT